MQVREVSRKTSLSKYQDTIFNLSTELLCREWQRESDEPCDRNGKGHIPQAPDSKNQWEL